MTNTVTLHDNILNGILDILNTKVENIYDWKIDIDINKNSYNPAVEIGMIDVKFTLTNSKNEYIDVILMYRPLDEFKYIKEKVDKNVSQLTVFISGDLRPRTIRKLTTKNIRLNYLQFQADHLMYHVINKYNTILDFLNSFFQVYFFVMDVIL